MKFTYSNVYLKMGHNRLMLGVFCDANYIAYASKIRKNCFYNTMLMGVVQMCGDVHVCFYPNKNAAQFLRNSTAQFK